MKAYTITIEFDVDSALSADTLEDLTLAIAVQLEDLAVSGVEVSAKERAIED